MTSKIDLRKIIRKRRHEFVIANNFLPFLPHENAAAWLLPFLKQPIAIATYVATKDEPNTLPYLCRHLYMSATLTLPWIDPGLTKEAARTAPICFRSWAEGEQLIETSLGFQQPDGSATEQAPDIILAPLLAFDKFGNRLGQGAGHYDRAFEKFPDAIRIGVGWSVQEVDQLEVDPWDVSLDAIMTEQSWFINSDGRLGPDVI